MPKTPPPEYAGISSATPAPSIHTALRDYMSRNYTNPEALHPVQKAEVRKAYFAGIYWALFGGAILPPHLPKIRSEIRAVELLMKKSQGNG